MLHWIVCSDDTGSDFNFLGSSKAVPLLLSPHWISQKMYFLSVYHESKMGRSSEAWSVSKLDVCLHDGEGRVLVLVRVNLVWIILLYIRLVSKSSNCYYLSSPFLYKVVVGKSEVVAPECRRTRTKKKHYVALYFILFHGLSPLHLFKFLVWIENRSQSWQLFHLIKHSAKLSAAPSILKFP